MLRVQPITSTQVTMRQIPSSSGFVPLLLLLALLLSPAANAQSMFDTHARCHTYSLDGSV